MTWENVCLWLYTDDTFLHRRISRRWRDAPLEVAPCMCIRWSYKLGNQFSNVVNCRIRVVVVGSEYSAYRMRVVQIR